MIFCRFGCQGRQKEATVRGSLRVDVVCLFLVAEAARAPEEDAAVRVVCPLAGPVLPVVVGELGLAAVGAVQDVASRSVEHEATCIVPSRAPASAIVDIYCHVVDDGPR